MFSLSANEGWAFFIAAVLGLFWPVFSADLQRSKAKEPPAGSWSDIWTLLWPVFLLVINASFWSDGPLRPMWLATAVSCVYAAIWLLVFGQLAKRHVWAKAWLGLPVGRIAGLIGLLTFMLWTVDAIHRHGMPWLTPSNIALAICAVCGFILGSTVPSLAKAFGVPDWVGRHVASRVSAFSVLLGVVLIAWGVLGYGIFAILHR